MTFRTFRAVAMTAAASFCLSTTSMAALSDKDRCLDGKHKAAGKHVACLVKTLAASVGEVPDFTRCDDALADAFAGVEDKYGSQCRTAGDAAGIGARNQSLVDSLEVLTDPAGAGTREALACALARLKAAGRRASCGAKAQSLLIKRDLVARDTAVCDSKLAAALAKAEEGGSCIGVVTAEAIATLIDTTFAEIEADLANLGTEDFANRGRYRAARQTLTFVDTTRPTAANNGFPSLPERTLVTDIYYPSVSTSTGAPVAEGGPFPVLIRAHGLGGFRTDSTELIRHLAGHGYVVVSPDFPLSNLNTPGGATLLDLEAQAGDVSYLISQLEALDAQAGGAFEGKLDLSRIGAIGHSLGGATVFAATYHPTLRDPRIDAVVGLAPFACFYQEAFFDGGATAPMMILAGDEDMITGYASNHLAVFGRANAEKYLVTLAGGTHTAFINELFGGGSNPDEELACPSLLPPGAERPYFPDFGIPEDFLGGAAAGVDTTGSTCEPICPPPPATYMDWDRQIELASAGTLAMFEREFRGSISADRFITGRIDDENDDVTLAYER